MCNTRKIFILLVCLLPSLFSRIKLRTHKINFFSLVAQYTIVYSAGINKKLYESSAGKVIFVNFQITVRNMEICYLPKKIIIAWFYLRQSIYVVKFVSKYVFNSDIQANGYFNQFPSYPDPMNLVPDNFMRVNDWEVIISFLKVYLKSDKKIWKYIK